MSISSYPIKRRRLDNGNSGLSKPFKSPLRAATTSQGVSLEAVGLNNNHAQQNDPAAITSGRPLTPHLTTRSAIKPSRANLKKDPQELTLQKQHSALLLQLTKLRQSLDTAQQALKITSSTTETDLESLISKWKLASREAAEEVFRGATDRVNQMGGMSAWRERNRKKPDRWCADEQDGGVGDLTEEQREDMEIQRDELEVERKKYSGEQVEVVVERDDDVS